MIKAKTLKPSHASIKKVIMEWLSWKGFFVIPIHQSLGSMRGLCDLIAIAPGITLFLEIKTPKSKLTDHQRAFGEKVMDKKHWYLVVTSVDDIEGFVEKLLTARDLRQMMNEVC